jgi:hypothetical protein
LGVNGVVVVVCVDGGWVQICRGGPKTFHFYLLTDHLCYSGKMFAGLPSQTVIPLAKAKVCVSVCASCAAWLTWGRLRRHA